MNKALWAVQILLAAAFAMAGASKLFMPAEALLAQMPWVETTGVTLARVAGLAELLGALGLVLPSALRIAPKLTPLAAAGLVAVMGGAMVTHGLRAEWGAIVVNVVLGGLAAFVAWGRAVRAPIAARNEATA